jgi:hypothetical protein
MTMASPSKADRELMGKGMDEKHSAVNKPLLNNGRRLNPLSCTGRGGKHPCLP